MQALAFPSEWATLSIVMDRYVPNPRALSRYGIATNWYLQMTKRQISRIGHCGVRGIFVFSKHRTFKFKRILKCIDTQLECKCATVYGHPIIFSLLAKKALPDLHLIFVKLLPNNGRFTSRLWLAYLSSTSKKWAPSQTWTVVNNRVHASAGRAGGGTTTSKHGD